MSIRNFKNIFYGAFASLLLVAVEAGAVQIMPLKAPIPKDNPQTKAKVELGKMLFFDKRLSNDNSVSCQTCHNVHRYGVDGLPTSRGIGGQFGGRNSPSVYNAAFLSVQFWDGRASSLEEQAKGPIINPKEMGMANHDAVVAKLKTIPGYVKLFESVFPKSGITIDNLAKAIAAFERTLITSDSLFARYQKGDKTALNLQQETGWKLFQSAGCITCHTGPVFAGPELPAGVGFYQKFPLIPAPDIVKKYGFDKDIGRMEATQNEQDRGMFRVPSLVNVAETGPWFSTGSVNDLREVVRIMAKTQRGMDMNDNEVDAIVAFLKTLTGKAPNVTEPNLPN